MTLLMEAALVMLMVLSCFMAWHPKYQDGLFGRIWLAGIVTTSLIMLMGEWTGNKHYELHPECEWLMVFLMLFMLRHVLAFLKHLRKG